MERIERIFAQANPVNNQTNARKCEDWTKNSEREEIVNLGKAIQKVQEKLAFEDPSELLLDSPDPMHPEEPLPEEDSNLYCLCQKSPMQCSKPMVCCDLCENWFHFECLKIGPRQQQKLTASSQSTFLCDFCKSYKALQNLH